MLAACLNLGSTEPSVFENGWTIFFGAYLVTTSAESVLPSASFKTNRDFADATALPWAAVEKSKPQAQLRVKWGKWGVRGLVFGINSATYGALSLTASPVSL